MDNLKQALEWRSAVKQFDPTQTLSDGQVKSLLETTLLAPSSFGLQPWKIVVVSDKEIKAKLAEAGYGQSQFMTASHVVVFAVNQNVDAAYVEYYMSEIARIREVSVESLEGFGTTIKGTIAMRTPEEVVVWSSRQVYIALGTLIAAASLESIDASPMEGFDGNAFDEILGLKEINCHALAVVALGHRSEEDAYSQMKKVRFDYESLVITK
jgi:nitroreductase